MEKLLIKGGNILKGEISCSGAKNAALPMIAATILNDEEIIFRNLPYLQDQGFLKENLRFDLLA